MPSVTRTAYSVIRIPGMVGIRLVIGVASWAVSEACMFPGKSLSPALIYSAGYSLQVVRVNARTVPAQVVDLKV